MKKIQSFDSLLLPVDDLLRIDPVLFLGDCEWVLRSLSKVVKTLTYHKEFEVGKDLLEWMLRCCYTLEEDRALSWFFHILKLVFILVDCLRIGKINFTFIAENELKREFSEFAEKKFGNVKSYDWIDFRRIIDSGFFVIYSCKWNNIHLCFGQERLGLDFSLR